MFTLSYAKRLRVPVFAVQIVVGNVITQKERHFEGLTENI